MPECRGEYPAYPPVITSGFPFGLCTARRELAIGRTLWSGLEPFRSGRFPRRPKAEVPMVWRLATNQGRGAICWACVPIAGAIRSAAFTGLRPRVMVSSWSARSRPARSHAFKSCSTRHPCSHAGLGPDGSCEWAIRVAASFAEGWIKQGAEVEMVIEGRAVTSRRRARPGHGRRPCSTPWRGSRPAVITTLPDN